MWISFFGLVIGLVLGFFVPFGIPVEWTRYTAIGILGIFDSILGATRADLEGKYNGTIFITGLLFNMLLAVIITYLGDKLSLDLYLAVIIVFTLRLFNNLATIRYFFLEKAIGRKRVEQELKDKDVEIGK